MAKFNLTEKALNHRPLMYYFILIIFFSGIYCYTQLGRMEDPDFIIRQMVVSVAWPGASAYEMEEQVTDKLEKKLQETPHLDYLKSVSRPGLAIIYINLKEDRPGNEVRPTWVEARNLVIDIQQYLPAGVIGPFFNDHFDDVFGSIYALCSEDFSYEELRDRGEKIRRVLLDVESVKKVDLVGVQEEKIYVEVENSRLAELGLPPSLFIETIKNQNAMTAAGMLDTSQDNVYLRISGMFDDLESIRNLPISAGGRIFRLADIATVSRDYADPATAKIFFNGRKAIGLAVSMEPGGNILKLGQNLHGAIEAIKQELPAGMEIEQVSDQPKVVDESIDDFVSSLREAVIIVLLVSFVSLGLRTGLVVALCIPLVLSGVFLSMYILGIDLHKVSLGALIISLGLLVDDEIIVVEMMLVKLESGLERFKAATAAYLVTAIPMLTGTLVTCAGFIPMGFSKGMAAEYTTALFPVISIAILFSWIVSVMVTPLIGFHIMKAKPKKKAEAYSGRFYNLFRQILTICLQHRKKVLLVTALAFFGSVYLLKYIKQEFFPPSLRPEIILEMTLPEGASMQATAAEAERMADFIDKEKGVKNYSYYVGQGAPRFVLTMEPILPVSNYAQFVIVAEDVDSRLRLQARLLDLFRTDFSNVVGNIKLIQTGPPVDYPIMLRVSGYDAAKVRNLAMEIANIMRREPNVFNVNFNWNEKSKALRIELDNDKLRTLGLNKEALSTYLQAFISGLPVAEYYEADRTIDIVLRMRAQDTDELGNLSRLPIYLPNGQYVPLEQVASKISFAAEDGSIWRRDLKPTITVRASITSGTANDMTSKIYENCAEIRANLPFGYTLEVDGALERSQKAINFMLQPVPVMILVIITILMLQLQRISLMSLALLTAPLGIIGVTLGMLIFDKPMGFVAELGIFSLSGMIIRNSVILIDQIEKHLAAGDSPWQAIIESAVLRFRPIMLTSLTAILAMIPLMRSTFWGPMAVAIASGLLLATVLTLLVLPSMYAAMFRVKETDKPKFAPALKS